VQFLHQCQLSSWLPLTYSTISFASTDLVVVTDIFLFVLVAACCLVFCSGELRGYVFSGELWNVGGCGLCFSGRSSIAVTISLM